MMPASLKAARLEAPGDGPDGWKVHLADAQADEIETVHQNQATRTDC